MTGLNVNMKLFADDVKLYSVVNEVNDLIAACNRIIEHGLKYGRCKLPLINVRSFD